MELWQVVLGGALMAIATVTVAIITTKANRAVARLTRDVEKQKADTADRTEDRQRYEGLLAGLRADIERMAARIQLLEDRDTRHMALVIAHMPWDARAEDVAQAHRVDLGQAPPLL